MRRYFVWLLALWFGYSATVTFAADRHPERPNILLIVADDQGYADMSITGLNNDAITPNLDQLARQGVRFTQAYASAPICNISRIGLMTGSYPHRFTSYWYGGKGLANPNFPTLAEALKQGGYATAYIGKFHYGRDSSPKSRNFPLNHGFDSFYGFAGGRKHYLIHNAKDAQLFKQRVKIASQKFGRSLGSPNQLKMEPMWINTQQVDQEGFSTELFGQQARKFLEQRKLGNNSQPFFLQLSFNAVHNFTHQIPADYLAKFGLTPRQDWQPEKQSYMEWYNSTMAPNNPQGRAYYLAQLSYLDQEVGKVLTALKQHDLADNTIVAYVSDNGGSTSIYADNGPLRGSKYTLYEGGIRVPLILRWPNQIKPSTTSANMVSAMDLYPTLLAAAKVDIPSHLDGINLTPLITGKDSGVQHNTLFWDSGHEVAIRHGSWKFRFAKDDIYAKRQLVPNFELGEFLYDLESDPAETNNLFNSRPDKVRQLKALYRNWQKSNHNGASF